MTIRLTEFEAAKAASLSMAGQGQDSESQFSNQDSAELFSHHNSHQLGKTVGQKTAALHLQEGLQTGKYSTSQRLAFYLIGILLTATAIAKLWMLLTDSFADVRVGIPKEILWLSVAFELWLAWQNFRIRDHRVMALINTIVFASFGVFATIRLMLGYGSCGCSGSLEVPAWIFIILDIAIVGWFTITATQRSRTSAGLSQLHQNWSAWSPEKRGRLAGIGIFASLIFVRQLPVIAPLRAMVLGEPPIVATIKIGGDLILNQETRGTVEIWNRSSQPAKIIGLSRSCRCFDLTGDPISKIIPANERLSLPLFIKPNKRGPLHQRVELFLDHPKQIANPNRCCVVGRRSWHLIGANSYLKRYGNFRKRTLEWSGLSSHPTSVARPWSKTIVFSHKTVKKAALCRCERPMTWYTFRSSDQSK